MKPLQIVFSLLLSLIGGHLACAPPCCAAGGTLTVKVTDEATDSPIPARFELWRGAPMGKPMSIRRAVPAGVGVVLDRSLDLSLADGDYAFRMIRGPEYRIVSGSFSLEETSLDDHAVPLPRMVDMLATGWTSGDCLVVASPNSLPLRMASEDLHLARTLGSQPAKPIAGRDRDEPLDNDPAWIETDARHVDGLALYGVSDGAEMPADVLPSEMLAKVASDDSIRVAIENPFAWPLPVWLASGRIDGFFILGDWLCPGRKVLKVPNGRGPTRPGLGDGLAVGRWAEQVYWNLLEAGFRVAPLAGSGSEGRSTPVGYNRLYVAEQLEPYQEDGKLDARRLLSPGAWWRAAWRGRSVATNGPLLRPKLGGQIPGHVFTATSGEVLQLQPELKLTVRDPVEYLEVVHNGKVHYSARLDEFAEAGGVIPPLLIKESSWVTVRVVTLHEDHFRAAMSAPWYIDFDSRPRMTSRAIDFFRQWLSEHETRLKRLPPEQLARHVPFVRSARAFWAARAESASQ